MRLASSLRLVCGGIILAGSVAVADDDDWAMHYYKHPEPAKIDNFLERARKRNLLSSPNTAAVTIGFMTQVMRDNPDRVTHWLELSEKYSKVDRQAILTAAWYSRAPQAVAYFEKANVTAFAGQKPPDLDAMPIEEASHLDFQWARFFASGSAVPIRRIVSALAYEKYSGAVDKFKSSKKTKEDEKAAVYDSIFQAATWSLESNCKQDKRVYIICKELFFSHELTETERLWLVVALSKARPDEFAFKLVSGKDPHLEITKSPPPLGLDRTGQGRQKNSGHLTNAENRKSEKDFAAQLLLTEDQKFFDDWLKPETPNLATTTVAHRNVRLNTVLLFSNPGLDKTDAADISADLAIRKPDGSIYADHKNLVCWKGKYGAAPFNLQLSQSRVAIRIEPQDPAGTYSVEAVVRDNIRKIELRLRQNFVVEK